MTLVERFKEFVRKENLFSPNDALLLAVSGGIDSVVLCELCKQAGCNFVIAHCNFKLRGKESERDKDFVQQLAKKYEVPFLLKEFETEQYAKEKKLSIQEAARELRYEWFLSEVRSPKSEAGGLKSDVRSQMSVRKDSFGDVRGKRKKKLQVNENAKYDNEGADTGLPAPGSGLMAPGSELPALILTAHHLDDNIETMLNHFFRGTGIHGLRGMLPKQGKIIRPLLFARKEELKQFAEENKLTWVEDSSNESDKYSRNYIRNKLMPFIRQLFPEADSNLADNLQRFTGTEILYEQAVALQKKKLLEEKGTEIHIPILKLKKTEPLQTLVYEIIKDYGFSAAQTGEVIELFDSESGKYIQSPTHRIIKNRKWLVIAPVKTEEASLVVIEEGIDYVKFAVGSLQLATLPVANCQLPIIPSIACLDTKNITFPLILRPCKKGDYFYPLGMQKKKKLARFFIDQKLSLTEKEKVWVLESNKKILWVIGMRIDDRFKITPSTKKVLQVKLS